MPKVQPFLLTISGPWWGKQEYFLTWSLPRPADESASQTLPSETLRLTEHMGHVALETLCNLIRELGGSAPTGVQSKPNSSATEEKTPITGWLESWDLTDTPLTPFAPSDTPILP